MTTTLSVTASEYVFEEWQGANAGTGFVRRTSTDYSQPLEVTLSSDDTSELVVPSSVTIPANAVLTSFPIDIIDDTLLDGTQIVTVTATAPQATPGDNLFQVYDLENAELYFDETEFNPGDTLTGNVTISVSGNTEPVTVYVDSSRPDEIAPFTIEVPVGSQTANFSVPVSADTIPEGRHSVTVSVDEEASGLQAWTGFRYVQVTDPGIDTTIAAVDGEARDTDEDGQDFETLTNYTSNYSRAPGYIGEYRSIIEFDVSAIPPDMQVQSAVLTLRGAGKIGLGDHLTEIYAYQGNGVVESMDALQINTLAGQWVFDNGLASYPIVLDNTAIQTLLDGGNHIGFVTKVDDALAGTSQGVAFLSAEYTYIPATQPALHLVLASNTGPTFAANSLTISENATVTLTPADLAANDPDTGDSSLNFTVSNVTRGQFLLSGNPATSFTQSDIVSGLVSFAHDGSEYPPNYLVEVTDGIASFGPQAATVTFTNVNDNPPVVPSGQTFSVSEVASNGTSLGFVSFSDSDLPGDNLSFPIVLGDPNGVFSISSAGELQVVDNSSLDYDVTNSYALTVDVSDGTHVVTTSITVDVLENFDPTLQIDGNVVQENDGAQASYGIVTRSGDLSQPVTILLSSSDTSKLTVPATLEIPAFEDTGLFDIDAVDNNLLDGQQVVTITATTPGSIPATADVTVLDYETVSLEFSYLAAPPTAIFTLSNTDRDEDVWITTSSSRPDEVSLGSVMVPTGQQSVSVPLVVNTDEIPEGPHYVKITYSDSAGQYYSTGDKKLVAQDDGVNTIVPAAAGDATDTDQDGIDFEDIDTTDLYIRPAHRLTDPNVPDARGIVEYDITSIPAGAVIDSAVLTVDGFSTHSQGSLDLNVFAYSGNGQIEPADALQTAQQAGQFATQSWIFGVSYPTVLDTSLINSLAQGGDHLGFVIVMDDTTDGSAAFHSPQWGDNIQWPLLHLTWSLPPTLTANSLTISEGQTVTLDASSLAATDADSDDDTLTFTVSNVSGGQFLINGTPGTTFSQPDVGAGLIAFAHNGGELAPSYDVTVSDGALSDGPDAASISFSNVNDNPPVIPAGQTFAVAEDAVNGASVGTVLFSDADLPGDSFTVNITAGDTFGLFAVDNGGLLTIGDNTNLDYETAMSHSITVEVSDGVNVSSQDVTVDITNVNDVAPSLDTNSLSVSEGGTVVLTASDLAAGDIDSDDAALLFQVSNVTGGQFLVDGSPAASFLQSQLGGGSVSFVHDDSEVAPAYDVSVSDGTFSDGPAAASISFANVNDNAPVIPAGQTFAIAEDAANDAPVGTVLFSDADLPGDSFTLNITAGDTFGLFAIDNGGLLTVGDNTNLDYEAATSHTITVEVSDGVNVSSQNVIVDISNVNDVAPLLTTNSLTISEGGTVVLSPSELAAGDIDSDDAALLFQVSNVTGGQFLVDGSPSTSFLQSQLGGGNVSFVHDDSELAPAYDVSVSDGTFSDGPASAAISFTNVNDNAPVIPPGQTFASAEDAANGAPVGTVLFSDADLPGDSFALNITAGDTFGLFAIDNSGLLTIGDNTNLDYESATSHTITVEVSDGVSVSSQNVTVDISNVNDVAPLLTTNSLTISEGGTVVLSPSDLAASDVDSDDAALLFQVSNVTGGQFLVGGSPATSFLHSQLGGGSVSFVHDDSEVAPAYDVSVSDGTFSDGPASAAISFTNVNDNAPVMSAGQTFSVSEDAANGTSVGTVLFSDSDLPGDVMTATITGGSGGVFSISNAGLITVADNTNLDYETTTTYSLVVEVFDGLNTTTETVVVDVIDVPEGPVTKFFVVDAGVDDMFEYTADGTPVVNYNLGSGNSAPRGATANAAGDRVWVIDNDDYVYVYDADGNSLGQWKASGLSRPEGIATDGADLWIVDRGHDKLFRFNGAAGFISGTHAADSDFSLDGSNSNARGVTSDGNHFWIINSKKNADYVHKYTVSGSYLGNWRLDGQNTRAEGITIDPTNVDDIWVVDRDRDQIFEYAGGTNFTSGNHAADALFDLAATNTDPRGIADPPPAKMRAVTGSAEWDSIALSLADQQETDPHRDDHARDAAFADNDVDWHSWIAERRFS